MINLTAPPSGGAVNRWTQLLASAVRETRTQSAE